MCWQLEDLMASTMGRYKRKERSFVLPDSTARIYTLRGNFDAVRKPVLKSKFHGSRFRSYFLWLRTAAGALRALENGSVILAACLQVLLQPTAAGSELQPLHMSLASLPPDAG